MSIIAIILLEFLFITVVILGLFNYRKRIGLAPLYILLGSLQHFTVNFENLIGFEFLDEYPIYPGPIILISAILFAILLIYIKEGVTRARVLILGIIISNFFLIGLIEITNTENFLMAKLSTLNSINTVVASVNYKVLIIGALILLADLFLLAIIYQFLISKIKKSFYFLTLFISLWITLIFDAIVFNEIMYFGTSFLQVSTIGHIIGKSISALMFSSILYLYLKFIDKDKVSTTFIADQKRDIFSILQYKKKYFDLQIEKIKNEEKIRAQFEKTLTSISDGIATLDKNWIYTYVNKQAGIILGRTPSSLVGKNIWAEYPEGVGLPFYKAYYKAVETQKAQYIQEYYEPFDKWYENRIYPSPSGLTIYFTDITEQKNAVGALIESEAFNEGILSSLSAHIAVIDQTGSILKTNTAWDDFSISNGEFDLKRTAVGSNYFDVCNDAIVNGTPELNQVIGGLKAVLNKEKTKFEIEYRCDSPSEKRWFVLRAEPFGTKANKVVISHTNITQRKIAEEEREISFAKLKEAQRMAKIGSWEFNPVTKECNFSDEMYDILEIQRDSTTDLYDAYRSKCLPEDYDTFNLLFKKTLKNNKYAFNYYIKSEKSTQKYIHEIGELFKNEKGEIIKLIGTIQDFTADKLVKDTLLDKNEELTKVNTELDRFVYSASHDLRAPLTSMRGLLQLMEMVPQPEEVEEGELHLLMAKTIDKMDKFISDILDYSINSRSELRNEKIDFEDMLVSCWEELKYMDVDYKPISTIKVDQKADFFSDNRRIKIILCNLLSNAIKYHDNTKKEHCVNMTVTSNAENAILIIEDNGIGIDNAYVDKIFDMFHRATKLSTGSGMGLYIVKETTEKLHGTIEVVSELGIGTTFTVTLANSN